MDNQKPEPKCWPDFVGNESRVWIRVALRFEWVCERISHRFSKWAFIEVLEYIGKLGLLWFLIAAIWNWPLKKRQEKQAAIDSARTAEAAKLSRHYAAWQTLNSSIGKPGNAGRAEALMDLAEDGISLAGVDLSGGAEFFRNLKLPGAILDGANLDRCDFVEPDFSNAIMDRTRWTDSSCYFGTFTASRSKLGAMTEMRCTNASFVGCDFSSQNWEGTALIDSTIDYSDFYRASLVLENCQQTIFQGCSFYGAKIAMRTNDLGPGMFTNCNFFGAIFTDTNLSAWVLKQGGAVNEPTENFADWIRWLDKNGLVRKVVRKHFREKKILP
jgi:uncharacterized protein YjbI with pentapeptide repeats